jgi:hypothetical protein
MLTREPENKTLAPKVFPGSLQAGWRAGGSESGPGYWPYGDPTLFFGARGITSLEITLYGPNNASVHSGHYGNWIPNPGIRLAHLLASMRDPDGRVKISGWYDTSESLTELEVRALREIPSFEKEVMENYGFIELEGNWNSLNESIQHPGLNLNGLSGGWVGAQQRTIIARTPLDRDRHLRVDHYDGIAGMSDRTTHQDATCCLSALENGCGPAGPAI